MINFDFPAFQKDLIEILTEILKKYQTEEICGFGLSSDEDARSVTASINTISHLNICWTDDPDEDKEYFKWYPAEWKYEAIQDCKLNDLSLKLFNLKHSLESKKDKKAIYELLVDTLLKLKNRGLFNTCDDGFVLVFNITDSDDMKSDLKWISELNPKELFNEYRLWTETW